MDEVGRVTDVKVELVVFHEGMRGRVMVNGQNMVELMRSSKREACASCRGPSEWRPLDMPHVRALCEVCAMGFVVKFLQDKSAVKEKRS